MITKIIQKSSSAVFLVSLGVIISIIFIEIMLRIAGYVYLSSQNLKNNSLRENNAITILCIGESTTAMGGNDSYPSQLERILNLGSKEKKFKVINKGIPGQGTDFILTHLEKWIDEYQPSIVMAMMGINDPPEYVTILNPNYKDYVFMFVKELRVTKLYYWILTAFNNRNNKMSTALPSIDESVALSEDNQLTIPDKYRDLYVLAMLVENNGNLQNAEEGYRRLLHLDPDLDRNLYLKLAENLRKQGKYEELMKVNMSLTYYDWGIDWIKNLCKPDMNLELIESLIHEKIASDENNANFYYQYLAACYEESGATDKVNFARQKADLFLQKRFKPLTKRNYLKLINILNKKRIKGVLVQYPMRNIDQLKNMLQPEVNLKEFILVDNESVFKEALKENSYENIFFDRFAGDFGHCTTLGNKILAENIASYLVQISF